MATSTRTFYLRPSADVSIEVSGESYYGGSMNDTSVADGSIYTTINEEVCDEDASYMHYSSDQRDVSTCTSIFKMSGVIPENKIKINKITGTIFASQSMGVDVTFTYSLIINCNGKTFSSETYDVPSMYTSNTIDLSNSEFIKSINIEDFSNVQISLNLSIDNQSNSDKTMTEHIYISQLYISVEYSTGIGVHHKVNGSWKAVNKAYQKQNGSWIEITEDQCKAILASAPVVLKGG